MAPPDTKNIDATFKSQYTGFKPTQNEDLVANPKKSINTQQIESSGHSQGFVSNSEQPDPKICKWKWHALMWFYHDC